MSISTTHAVPDTASGFLYQFERALYRLATCRAGSEVGVETDDDVAVLEPSGSGVLEQDKLSGRATGHPFQDRSKGLWNTLLVWLRAARDGEDRHREAELHMVTNRPAPPEALACRIGKEALDADEARACVIELRNIASDPSKTMAALMTEVCAFTDEQISAVIQRVRFSGASSATEGAALRKSTVSALHIPQELNSDRVIQALLGWMQDTLRAAWRSKAPGWISRVAFDRQLDAVLRQERAMRKRERAEFLVPVTDDQRRAARSNPFVERLIEVEVEEDDILRAVDCYLRFSAERFRLANEGDITSDEWGSFFSHLGERWDAIKRRVIRNRAQETEELTGRKIYFETAEGEHLAPLAGRQTEHYYFTTGGYHRLADNDLVWWLPSYRLGTGGSPEERDGL